MPVGRRRARREAVFALYRADLLGLSVDAALERTTLDAESGSRVVDPYVRRLLEGVAGHREAIDRLISRRLVGWTIERLAPLERSILRLGVLELLYVEDVPEAVAIDEAVQLAKTFCSDEAGALVNGVLGAVLAGETGDRGEAGEYTPPSS